MKKSLFYFLLILFFKTYSQEQPVVVSISFEDAEIIEVLQDLEDITPYKFYFIEEWLKEEKVTGNYENEPISNILQELFQDTPINYYFLDNKVILTKNNIIYDDLPAAFLPGSSEDDHLENINKPIFYEAPEANQGEEIQTARIGKEDRNSAKRRFTLSGYIYDKQSGEPISNLALIVRNTNTGTVTDINGYYELSLAAGEYILETRSLGSENLLRRVVIYNDGALNFQLNENYEALDEVVLETSSEANVRSVVAGVQLIKASEIKTIPLVLGERDILKVATMLPGISTAGEGSSGYNVRGGRADQNLILLDDAVIYNPSHFFGLFSAINPFTAGDVEIYKGHIPAKYGGRLSSVFDIRTKEGNEQKFSGEAAIGPVTSNIALEIPIVENKASLIMGGRSTYSDWILRSLDEESLNNSTANFYDVILKYGHRINDKNTVKATGYFSRDVFSLTSDSLFSYNNLALSLRYDRKINNKNDASLIFTNSNYKFNIEYDNEFANSFNSGYRINETEAKLNVLYKYNSRHNFNYGISSKLYMVNPGEINPLGADSKIEEFYIPEEKGLESALYLSDDWEITDKLMLSTGLRYSFYAALGPADENVYEEGLPLGESTVTGLRNYGKNEIIKTYGGPEVRVSARYLLNPELSIKGSFNNTIQYIHTLSNNTTVSPTDIYKLSGSYIKPQRATQYSLGAYKNFEDNMYEVSLEGYYKKSRDMLDFKVGAQLFLNENTEAEVLQGQGKSYGVEFLLKKNSGRLNGWLGYTYSRSLLKLDGNFNEEIINGGEYFAANFDKPHDLSVVTNYKLTKRFSFSANFVYQTGRPITYPIGKYNFDNAEYVYYSDRNQYRIPDYYRLDLSFNVEGNHKIEKLAHSFWNISIYNVLGRNNPYSVFFVTDNGEVEAYQSSIFSIPVPTITYNFKF
ncbi:TonB-dependent receptor [Salegentibacter sp. F188]|uniref:TonB-dependent receptor n=1 Tax=Autumnicola patrickiae TaxID=3075591 RepID=A0ABU3E4P5_9FLAO|nr:carboxypeptidase-like regulatory domain-containing protein [Salegentibacter sp. F188]MDT0690966.1 TonB-dependent receptor [Salegentibacter sp. F188]